MAGDGRQDRDGAEVQARGDAAEAEGARRARLRGRNLLLGGALLLLVLLIYAISFVKTPRAPDAPPGNAMPAAQPLSGVRGN